MINHRWNDNTCVKCGVKRKKHYSKLLMAITDFPPYDHYLREMIWLFSFDGLKWKADRPDCKIISVNPSVMRSVCAHEDCTEDEYMNGLCIDHWAGKDEAQTDAQRLGINEVKFTEYGKRIYTN